MKINLENILVKEELGHKVHIFYNTIYIKYQISKSVERQKVDWLSPRAEAWRKE